jgi:hypothetical protein
MPAWFTAWAATVTLGDVIAWLVIAGTGAGILWKGWPIFRKGVGFLSRGIKLVDTLADLPAQLEFIKHELDLNSGKSVKDTTIRTEKLARELVAAIGEVRGDIGAVKDDVSHVKRQNAALKTAVAKSNRALAVHVAGSSESSTNESDNEKERAL